MRMGRHVHVIESPSADDFYDDVREGPLLTEGFKLLGIRSRYQIVIDQGKFRSALEEVQCNDPLLGSPILHLSMHGSREGLTLSDGSRIKWDHLKSLLVPINSQLNGKLLLCMSSCQGISGIDMALGEPENRRPFSVIVGSPNEMKLSDLALGFLTFYNHLLTKDAEIDEALEAMQKAAGAYFMKISADNVAAGPPTS